MFFNHDNYWLISYIDIITGPAAFEMDLDTIFKPVVVGQWINGTAIITPSKSIEPVPYRTKYFKNSKC